MESSKNNPPHSKHVIEGAPTYYSQALRADVDRVEAKKLAEKAHDASYLGQVMRGEKKMKRFLRRAGGEVSRPSFIHPTLTLSH